MGKQRPLFIAWFVFAFAAIGLSIAITNATGAISQFQMVEHYYQDGKVDLARQLLKQLLKDDIADLDRYLDEGRIEVVSVRIRDLCREIPRVSACERDDRQLLPFDTIRDGLAAVARKMGQRKPADDRERFLIAEARAAIGSILKRHASLLRDFGKDAAARELESTFGDLLEAKALPLDPDSPLFIERSYARPGPLQTIDACYRMKMPEEGRKRFLALVAAQKKQVQYAIGQEKLTPDLFLAPERMSDWVTAISVWERGNDQFPPPEALPVLLMAVSETKGTFDLLSAVRNASVEDAYQESLARVNLLQRAADRKFAGPPPQRPHPSSVLIYCAAGLVLLASLAWLWARRRTPRRSSPK